MYIIKNPRANPNLRSPINRPEYHDLDPEVQALYQFDAGVDEGDDGFTEAYADNALISGDADSSSSDINSSDDFGANTDLSPEDGKSDGFDGYGGGSFGGGGSEDSY